MGEEKRIFSRTQADMKTARALFSPLGLDMDGIEPIRAGMSTSNYRVTAQGRQYLLKIYPLENDRSLLVAAMYRHAAACGIRVPELLYRDDGGAVIPNSYSVLEYIPSRNLTEYLRQTGSAPPELFHQAGRLLARLHGTAYPDTGWLGEDLTLSRCAAPVGRQLLALLDGSPGKRLGEEGCDAVREMIAHHPGVLSALEAENVLSHGDYNFSNLLVDDEDNLWVIDFEYAFSCSPYYDIGKFFRLRSPDVQAMLTPQTASSFWEGYACGRAKALPQERLALAKCADILGMLQLMRWETMPEAWIGEIREEIAWNLGTVRAAYS